jgi:cytochrome b pre-mRNA-processing protein 3
MFAQWRARRASKILIDRIHGEIVAASRRPALYADLGAPDRIDGRFELLTLHAGLALRRLVALDGLGAEMAQDLVNSVFRHFDDGMRERAIGDVGVAKRLKKMGAAFYGRNAAYAAALDAGSPNALAQALARNVYGAADLDTAPKAHALAVYVASIDAVLGQTPLEVFSSGRFRFPQGGLEDKRGVA